jgi:hypothetical protein
LQWPFQQWGATAVLSGGAHDYERLVEGTLPYFVNGLGGSTITTFGPTAPGSQFQYNADYGAMLVDATATSISFKFYNAGLKDGPSRLIDSYTITLPSPTPVASQLGVSAQATATAGSPFNAGTASISVVAASGVTATVQPGAVGLASAGAVGTVSPAVGSGASTAGATRTPASSSTVTTTGPATGPGAGALAIGVLTFGDDPTGPTAAGSPSASDRVDRIRWRR